MTTRKLFTQELKALCDSLEAAADADKIITHASITAKPFFARRGYRVKTEQLWLKVSKLEL